MVWSRHRTLVLVHRSLCSQDSQLLYICVVCVSEWPRPVDPTRSGGLPSLVSPIDFRLVRDLMQRHAHPGASPPSRRSAMRPPFLHGLHGNAPIKNASRWFFPSPNGQQAYPFGLGLARPMHALRTLPLTRRCVSLCSVRGGSHNPKLLLTFMDQ